MQNLLRGILCQMHECSRQGLRAASCRISFYPN